MLSVILSILKFIGILLAVLLLLLLSVILALLFAPLRYRVKAVCTAEQTAAELHLHWLLYLISIQMKYDLQNGTEAVIRICGIPLSAFGRFAQRFQRKKRSRLLEEEDAAKMLDWDEEDSDDADVCGEEPDNTAADGIEEDAERSEEAGDGEEAEDGAASGEELEDETPDETNVRKRRVSLSGVFRRIQYKIQHICATIRKTAGKLAAAPQSLQNYLELLKRYEAKELFFTVWRELLGLLRHYGPRRISGYLHFGTGDPALTGQLTGVIYILLPARCADFSIEPDFHDAVLQTEVVMKGHIRACHLVGAGWRLYKNKKLKRFLKKIRRR